MYRADAWATDRFLDTLAPAQQRAFFLAAALYFLCWLACLFRVVNLSL